MCRMLYFTFGSLTSYFYCSQTMTILLATCESFSETLFALFYLHSTFTVDVASFLAVCQHCLSLLCWYVDLFCICIFPSKLDTNNSPFLLLLSPPFLWLLLHAFSPCSLLSPLLLALLNPSPFVACCSLSIPPAGLLLALWIPSPPARLVALANLLTITTIIT